MKQKLYGQDVLYEGLDGDRFASGFERQQHKRDDGLKRSSRGFLGYRNAFNVLLDGLIEVALQDEVEEQSLSLRFLLRWISRRVDKLFEDLDE